MGAFLRHGRRHQKVEGGQISDRRGFTSAACPRARRPLPRTQRDRRVRLSLTFVRGLMFYYGLDFHDLAPDSFLHITTFIVVCEAFLRVTPHFGLWLKTFEVKPKMIEGQQAACGGASIRKMTGAP